MTPGVYVCETDESVFIPEHAMGMTVVGKSSYGPVKHNIAGYDLEIS